MKKSYLDSVNCWSIMSRDSSVISLYRLLFSLNAVKFTTKDYDTMDLLTVSTFSDQELQLANEIDETMGELFKCENDEEALSILSKFASVLYVRGADCYDANDTVFDLNYNPNHSDSLERAADMYVNFCAKYKNQLKYHVVAIMYTAYLLRDTAPIIFDRSDYNVELLQSEYSVLGQMREMVQDTVSRLHDLCRI